LACAVETTLFGSVGTRSAGPEAKERMLEVESRSKTAEERIIVPRRRGKDGAREYDAKDTRQSNIAAQHAFPFPRGLGLHPDFSARATDRDE
jgi:hypothetical protein